MSDWQLMAICLTAFFCCIVIGAAITKVANALHQIVPRLDEYIETYKKIYRASKAEVCGPYSSKLIIKPKENEK